MLLLLVVGCTPKVIQPPDFPLPPGVPREAAIYRAAIIREVRFQWSLREPPHTFFAQIHQESRFKATAQSRFASGLTQFTPPTAEWIQGLYPADLGEFCQGAQGCPLDARWAIRAMLLYDCRLYGCKARETAGFFFAAGDERFAFMLASYNGGAGWIARERRQCLGITDCDPKTYFHQVERQCGQTRPARSETSCRENREYPAMILFKWRPLYRQWLPI